MSLKPIVGDIVHYVSYGTPGGRFKSVCRAAIVTDLESSGVDPHEAVSLCVLNPSGMFFDQGLPHDEREKAAGSWHWPEKR